MFSNRAVFAGLAIACIAAAGAGGYLATRQNAVPVPLTATTPTAETAASKASDRPIQGTETSASDARASAPAVASADTTTSPAATPISKRPAPVRATSSPSPSTTSAGRDVTAADRPLAAGKLSPLPSVAVVPSVAENSISAPRLEETPVQEPPAAPATPQKIVEELVISANSVIGLQTEGRISSETARVEDRVDAKVTRDVRVADKTAIPAGSRAIGSVMLVERGGKFKERARIGIRFTTLVLPDGTRLPISTETIYRDGEPPSNSSAAKVGGGAIAGTILGAIIGGSKGAAAGAAVGAAGGAAVVEAGDRNAVTLPSGSPMTVRLLAPVAVTVEQP